MEFHPEFNKKLIELLSASEPLKGTQAGTDDRILDAEGLILKFVYHCSTLDYLLKKTPSPLNNGNRFIDYASMILIIRAAFESALSFIFIFNIPENKDELDLRYWLWHYNGIQQLNKEELILDENKSIYLSLKEKIKTLEDQIKGNAIFGRLPSKFAKHILKKGEWRIINTGENRWQKIGWAGIATEVGFEDTVAGQLYSFLSSYAHSDSLCISLIREAKSESDRLMLLDGSFDILEYLIKVMTDIYASTIKNML